jgi:hypothetical protein
MKSTVIELSDTICLVGKTNNAIMTQLLKHQIITYEIAVQMYEKFEPDEKELKLIKGFKELIEYLKTQMYKRESH